MSRLSDRDLEPLRSFVAGTYSAEDVGVVLWELAHAEAENGMLPTQDLADRCAGILAWFSLPPADQPVTVAGDGGELS